MTHINIKISKAVATAEKDGIITTGMVGVPVSFMFDSWWDGLTVTAVFKGSGAPISVPLLGATETVVPWEVLKRPSTLLRIGAEGRLPDGTLVIPTTWATVDIVMSGANATDDLAKPPTPTAFDRIMSQIGNMNDLATEDKSSLVAAVNEAMEKGGGIGIDTSLTVSGKAADAAVVGEKFSELSEEIVTTAESKVSAHNTGADTHSDIRLLIQGLTDRLNALADSDDTTLDQMSEVVAYIKSNKSMIDAITTSKVSVADIVGNLTTNASNKPLSAAQGVVIKTLIDALRNDKLDVAELTNAINTALAKAKASGEFDGADGKSAYQYAVDGGYTGTEAEFAAKLAEEMPTTLPNPNALTFTGAVTGSYDGSAPVSVEIPSGGDNGGAWELVADVTMETDVQQIDIALSKSCKRVWVAVTLYGSKQNSGKSDFYICVGDKDYKNMIGNTNRVGIDFSSASMIWNFQSLYAEVSGGVIHEIRGYQTSSAFINGWGTPGNYPSAGLTELFGSAPFEKIETVRLQMWGVYFGAGTRVVVRGT